MAEIWADIGHEIVKGADVILGALLGAGSAFVASFFADRRRFKREDRYRDHAERRQVYAEFLSSWLDLEESRRWEGEQAEWFRGEARQRRQRSLAVIRLIAPEHVHSAAERTRESGVSDFIRAAREDMGKRPP